MGTFNALKSCFQWRSFIASDLRSEIIELLLRSTRSVSCTYSNAAYCLILVGISLVDANSPSSVCLSFLGWTELQLVSRRSLIWVHTPDKAVHTDFKSRSSSK